MSYKQRRIKATLLELHDYLSYLVTGTSKMLLILTLSWNHVNK
jgi:hypothetical protein